MPQPSLQGRIHGVPDNVLYADALSPERVLTFASALTGFDLKPHNPARDARFVTLSFPGWNHYRRDSMT
jgi:hypothetical protein